MKTIFKLWRRSIYISVGVVMLLWLIKKINSSKNEFVNSDVLDS